MTTELYIRKYDLSAYESDLSFADDLPVVIGYIRVSSDIQVDEGHSLDAQLVFIREACQKRFADGYHLIFVADPGLSGTLFYKRKGHNTRRYRPGLTIVIELIERGVVQFLCCYKCDRLCRNLEIWLEFEKNYLKKYKVEFFATAEPVSNTDVASKFIADILMANADYAGATIREISKNGIDKRRAAGHFFCQVCFGWRWQDERLVPAGQYVEIEQHPKEAPIVRKVIDWYLSGRSVAWIAGELKKLGIRTYRGNTTWDKSSVKKVIMNPRHCGHIKDISGNLVRGAHYPMRIIDESTHQALHQRDSRVNSTPISACTEDAFLRGLAQCGICGAAMRLISGTRTGAQYRCHGKNPASPHPSFGVFVSELDSWVCEHIAKWTAAQECIDSITNEVKTSLAAQESDIDCNEERNIADMDAIKNERNNIIQMYKDGDLSKEEYEVILKEQDDERAAIEKRLADIKQRISEGIGTQARLKRATDMVRQFPAVWTELEVDDDQPPSFIPLLSS